MKKKSYLFITLLLFITKVNAQFIGYYNLHDGGVDVPNSSLFILPNNEFMLFYLDGYKAGEWKEIDKNNIKLIEIRANRNLINIISKRAEKALDLSIDVKGLVKTHAFINFSNDTISTKEFRPIFNDWTNCIDNQYIIKKKMNEYKYLTIALPKDPKYVEQSIKYPYKARTYTFTLKNISGDYYIQFDEEALKERLEFTLTKKGGFFTLDESIIKLERKDITTKINEQINNAKKQIAQTGLEEKLVNILPCIATSSTIIYKSTLIPIFIAKCEGDKVEENEYKVEKRKLPTTDRANGFYSVVNFKENEYDIDKYKLEKEPSIIKDDILYVYKIVSDYGGYEIEIIFTETGSAKFAALSKKNIRKPIAIVVNKSIISAPILASEILGGKVIITGRFSEIEIDDIIENLKK